jgi:undecaprenyl-diphosphatase
MTHSYNVIGYVTAVDHKLMRRVHWWPAPRWVRLWMVCATRGGDGWLWYAMGLAILLFGGESRLAAVGASALAAASGIVLFLWLKRYANRRRPCAVEPHCWSTLLPPDQFSFPSGHTITAFAVVTPLMLAYPALAAGLLFCAASIAVSRILLGMHFLSDVVAGAIIGSALGYVFASIFIGG